MKTLIWTDGATHQTNPGPAGIGALIKYDDNEYEICEPIGWATNNEAEYAAVCAAIEFWILEIFVEDEKATKVKIMTDSALVANQANGEFKMKAENLKSWLARLKNLIRLVNDAGGKVTIKYIPREKNIRADFLSKEAASISTDDRVEVKDDD